MAYPPCPPARSHRWDFLPAVVSWNAEPDRSVLLIHDMQRYLLKPFPDGVRQELVRNPAGLRDRCFGLGVPVACIAQPGSRFLRP